MSNLVDKVFACPVCGERDSDKLEHDSDVSEITGHDHIKCLVCDKEYVV
jgi:transcription elongation factor Elf1